MDRSQEGYRNIWIKSSAKAAQDRARREEAITAALAELHELSPRLNRRQLKKKSAIRIPESEAEAVITSTI